MSTRKARLLLASCIAVAHTFILPATTNGAEPTDDTKSYKGALCRENVLGAGPLTSITGDGGIRNDSTDFSAFIVCPIIKDGHGSPGLNAVLASFVADDNATTIDLTTIEQHVLASMHDRNDEGLSAESAAQPNIVSKLYVERVHRGARERRLAGATTARPELFTE